MTAIKIRSGRVRSGTLRGPADSSRATSPLLYTPLISKTNKNVLQIFKSLYATPVHAGDWAAKGSSIQLPSDIKSMWSTTGSETQATNWAASVANDTSVGTLAWNSATINNVLGPPDGVSIGTGVGTWFTGSNTTSNYLKITNFNLNIPTGATIQGISVTIRRSTNGSGLNDSSIKIVKGGTISGTDQSAGASWGNTLADVTFGGSSNLWGLSWTVSDINSSNFGVAFSAINTNSFAQNVLVDAVAITVYYTETTATKYIYITTQESNGRVAYHKFNTSTDTWSIKNELVVQAGTTGGYPAVSHVVLSDGSVVVAYANTATSDLYYIKRSSGTWGTAASLSSPGYGVVATLGTSDRVHFIFKGSSALLLHKSLTSGGTLNGSNTIDSTTASTIPLFPIGPGATTSGGTIAVPYKDADNNVSVVKFTSADSPTFTIDTAVSAASAYEFTNTLVAQTLANGTDLHLIYADNSAQDIFLDKNSGAGWGTDTNIQTATAQGISAAVLT